MEKEGKEISWPEHSPPEHPPPEVSLPRYSPIPSPPPAKRTRKAVKRRCEAELLRGGGEWDTLLLSPPHGSPLSPTTLPPPRTPPSLLSPGPSSPIRVTPEPPSPTTARPDFLTPPPTALAPQSAPEAAEPDAAALDAAAPEVATNENSEPVQCPLTTDGRPHRHRGQNRMFFPRILTVSYVENVANAITIIVGITIALCVIWKSPEASE